MSSDYKLPASLILATYEMPKHLAMVFAALERQSFRQFEILICDDGSGEETRAVIQEFKKNVPMPVYHLWQENRGFRKSRILNQAIRQSRGETLIFLDGDCVPHKHFIKDHVLQQEEGYYLAGRRVELGQEFSEWLNTEHVRSGYLDFPRWQLIRSFLKDESEHPQRTFRVTLPWLRKVMKMNQVDDLKGCNYSVSRKNMVAINGYDEDYEGYGREDADIELRLQHLGLQIKSLKGLALQFHVWHPRREFTPANDDLLEQVKISKRVRCDRGLDQGLV